jgi:hypothetical protein
MMVKNFLTEEDLKFVVQAVAPEARDKEMLQHSIKEDPAFRKNLLGDGRLLKKIQEDPGLSLGISPSLFFEVMLRNALKEMEKSTHTIERSVSLEIPVFDIKETLKLFNEDDIFYYLLCLLVSFLGFQKNTASDISIDNLFEFAGSNEEKYRFAVYKRIGDICLLTLGIFPETLMFDYFSLAFKRQAYLNIGPQKNIGDYEYLGKEAYVLASRQPAAKDDGLDEILYILSQNLPLAKKPLNVLSRNYLVIRPPKSAA